MRVKLLFFATIRDYFRTGEREVTINLPKTVREIFMSLFEDKTTAQQFLSSVRFAINCAYVSHETPVKDGDELAVIPPVSGG